MYCARDGKNVQVAWDHTFNKPFIVFFSTFSFLTDQKNPEIEVAPLVSINNNRILAVLLCVSKIYG